MNNKLEETWQEAVVAYFTTLSQHLTAGTGKNHETPCKDSVYNKMAIKFKTFRHWERGKGAGGESVGSGEAVAFVTAVCGRTDRRRLPTEMFTDRGKQKE